MLQTVAGTALLSSTASSMDGVMNNGMTLGERLQYSAEMTTVGLLIVFAVLGIIYLAMMLFRLVFYTIPNRRTVALPAKDVTEIPDEVSEPQSDVPDTELVAVITAAVAAILADEAEAAGKAAPGFRVVSFRRAGKRWDSRT